MRKADAMFRIWYDKFEMMSYKIGDDNGAFSDVDMKDFHALETLVYVSAGSKIYREPAQALVSLFEICDPNHRYVNDEDRKGYKFMLRRMNKLAMELGQDPITPPNSSREEDDDE
ncbi:MAG: hypothetical protein LC687_01340 [Actinobacteria bacterium]|nr:hypothetical protein [Actinomycetota bacterium]